MLLAEVLGWATTTVAHRSFSGQRLVVVQPLGASEQPDGDPQLAVDCCHLGVGRGQRVVISSDGKSTREFVGDANSPIRWSILAIADEAVG